MYWQPKLEWKYRNPPDRPIQFCHLPGFYHKTLFLYNYPLYLIYSDVTVDKKNIDALKILKYKDASYPQERKSWL